MTEVPAPEPERPSWFLDQPGATVVHPDELREAFAMPTSPPTPVVPPISDSPPGYPPPAVAAPTGGRRGRGKRADRREALAAPPSPERPPTQPSPDQLALEIQAQDAALDAYLKFAREGSMVAEDYYRGPVSELRAAAPAVVVADSLIPTGKPRLAPQPDKPRGPKIAAALVVLAIAGGGYYYETHQVTAPPVTGIPAVTLDQTTATTGAGFTVPATATSGASYRLTVPAGWKAVSQPTRAGGSHTDVTVSEPILGLSVEVRSDAASTPTTRGTPVDTALRVFGRPAGIVAPATTAASTTVSRVATVTRNGVRYAVTLTVPRESASRDYARADVVARSLTETP